VAVLIARFSVSPLGWGLFEFNQYRSLNFIALLGFGSVFYWTGSIGLFELDNKWLAIKEASILR